MKTKRIIKFLSLMMATVILLLSFSISISATDDVPYEGDPSYDDNYSEQDDMVMNCAPPVWVVPIIIAIAPLAFCFNMFNSFIRGDFSILNEIPELFIDLWSAVFG